MDLLEDVKNMLTQGEKFTRSKNYYFETHTCDKTDAPVKVQMDYILHKEPYFDQTVDFIKFGMCPHCKEVFYHKNYTEKGFSGKIKF